MIIEIFQFLMMLLMIFIFIIFWAFIGIMLMYFLEWIIPKIQRYVKKKYNDYKKRRVQA